MIQAVVARVHFDDFSGEQFERLCFAYLLRRSEFSNVEWYGQLGADGGEDIVATRDDGTPHIFQCANYRRLTLAKVKADIAKVAARSRSAGAMFTLIAGGQVSAPLRDKVRAVAVATGFAHADIWSAAEMEERLRRDAPDLLRRFVEGVLFPELPSALIGFAADSSKQTDDTIVRGLAVAFDRPAFKTPFNRESSLPRFRAAIAEALSTLNTGQGPSGKVLASKHDVRDSTVRRALDDLVERLVQLRATFDQLIRDGEIRGCGCGQDDCPVFMMSDVAARTMDHLRLSLLLEVHRLHPAFEPAFYHIT